MIFVQNPLGLGQIVPDAASVEGERFVFTPSKPITLERQKSLMIPLKVATIPSQKVSVFSRMPYGQTVNPKLCIELTNTSGLKLPAGAITVYDDGYAGDAMMEFLPDNEKRLIAYGDNLLLKGASTSSNTNKIEKVKMNKGILTIENSRIFSKKYTIKNSGTQAKDVIIEHNKTANYELYETEKPVEKTANLYRFKKSVPANKTIDFQV
ncbi:MAG: hypothetical protein CR984_00220, partial [Proteobacteria bacterium]